MKESATPVLEYAPDPREQRSRVVRVVETWGKIIVVISVSTGVGFFLQHPTYRAMGYLMQTGTAQTNLDTASVNRESQNAVISLRTPAVEQAVLVATGRQITPHSQADLRQSLAIVAIQDSKLVQVCCEDSSGTLATATVNAVIGRAVTNAPMAWGVAQRGGIAGGPLRNPIRALYGFFAGVMLVLGWRILVTTRARRRRSEE